MSSLESRSLTLARWVIRIFCWLVGGAMFLKSALTPIPELADLREFSAKISSVEESEVPGKDRRIEIRFEGRNATYHIPGWIPGWQTIVDQIYSGRELRAWSDIGASYMLWQIESEDIRLLSHESSSRAANRRRWFSAGMGIILLSLPLVAWFMALAKHRRALRKIRQKDQRNSGP